MSQLETTAYYAFGIPLYLALMGAEHVAARRRGRPTASFPETIGNLSAGLGAIVVGLFMGPLLILLYDTAYTRFALVRWGPSTRVLPWVLAVVLTDLSHYWHHRVDHRVAALWAVHGVHHQPEELNFTVAMRHAWFSDIYAIPFYAPLPLLGVPTSHFFVATTLLSLHALITHTREMNFPALGLFVTPGSHALHHARNPRYIDKNFGAMLSIWDRIFGTHVEESPDEPPVWGTVRGYETHDGVLSQWILWRDLAVLVRASPGWRAKARVLLGKPGSAPPGVSLPPARPPPRSAHIPKKTKLFVLFQFALTVLCSSYVFVFREDLGGLARAVSAGLVVLSLITLGGLLDGRWNKARLPGRRVDCPR